MSKYLVLIYESEDADANHPDYAKHWTFIRGNRASIVAGEALQPTDTATCLHHQDDGTYAVTDGPWTETKEALGGFYLLEARDLDHALDLARQIPAPYGGLEVRPIMEMEAPA